MCFTIPLRVKKVTETQVEMEDGRIVRLDKIKNVNVGDYLEVYADIVVTKLSKKEALSIRKLIKANQ